MLEFLLTLEGDAHLADKTIHKALQVIDYLEFTQ